MDEFTLRDDEIETRLRQKGSPGVADADGGDDTDSDGDESDSDSDGTDAG